jgi:uroporphyrinogen III methyltransferase/synthase
MPRAAVARDLVPHELTQREAHVDVVEAYRTVAPANLAEHAADALARNPHWIVFTSSSTVRNLGKAIDLGALRGIKIASIGPITSQTIRECGLEVDAEADPHTMQGLVAAIVTTSGQEALQN